MPFTLQQARVSRSPPLTVKSIGRIDVDSSGELPFLVVMGLVVVFTTLQAGAGTFYILGNVLGRFRAGARKLVAGHATYALLLKITYLSSPYHYVNE